MNRREFLRSGAFALAALVVPKSKAVESQELEEAVLDRDF